jgi:hypothetical protein
MGTIFSNVMTKNAPKNTTADQLGNRRFMSPDEADKPAPSAVDACVRYVYCDARYRAILRSMLASVLIKVRPFAVMCMTARSYI